MSEVPRPEGREGIAFPKYEDWLREPSGGNYRVKLKKRRRRATTYDRNFRISQFLERQSDMQRETLFRRPPAPLMVEEKEAPTTAQLITETIPGKKEKKVKIEQEETEKTAIVTQDEMTYICRDREWHVGSNIDDGLDDVREIAGEWGFNVDEMETNNNLLLYDVLFAIKNDHQCRLNRLPKATKGKVKVTNMETYIKKMLPRWHLETWRTIDNVAFLLGLKKANAEELLRQQSEYGKMEIISWNIYDWTRKYADEEV